MSFTTFRHEISFTTFRREMSFTTFRSEMSFTTFRHRNCLTSHFLLGPAADFKICSKIRQITSRLIRSMHNDITRVVPAGTEPDMLQNKVFLSLEVPRRESRSEINFSAFSESPMGLGPLRPLPREGWRPFLSMLVRHGGPLQ